MLKEPFLSAFDEPSLFDLFHESLDIIPAIDINSEDLTTREDGYKKLATLLSALAPDMEINSIQDMLKADYEFANNLHKAHKVYNTVETQVALNHHAGIPDNTRLDQRNSAMSDIATMLGLSGIIARATPMKIVNDGQVIEGTFMEKAVGEDINHLSKDSLMLQANEDSFNHPAGLKKLADLQILDYICGNIDRHSGNVMYQFEKNEDGKVILTGICGIDNDASFGTELFDSEFGGKEIATLPNIKNMSTSCFEAVSNLSLDALRLVLKDKLKETEIEAACKRVELLQEKMKVLEKDKGITPVPDDAWGKGEYTYDKLAGGARRGLAKTIGSVVKGIKQINDRVNELPENKESLTYAEGVEVTDEVHQRFGEIYNKVNNFVEVANKVKGTFHIDSKEYKNMMTALNDLKRYSDYISKELAEGNKISADEFEALALKTTVMGAASQNYLDAKELSQSTSLGQNRFAFATAMRDFAQENFTLNEILAQINKAPAENQKAEPEKVQPVELDEPEDEMEL